MVPEDPFLTAVRLLEEERQRQKIPLDVFLERASFHGSLERSPQEVYRRICDGRERPRLATWRSLIEQVRSPPEPGYDTLMAPYQFAVQLKEKIRQQGKSQKHLAEAAGVSSFSLSRWCNGIALPPARDLQRILGLLRLDAEEEEPLWGWAGLAPTAHTGTLTTGEATELDRLFRRLQQRPGPQRIQRVPQGPLPPLSTAKVKEADRLEAISQVVVFSAGRQTAASEDQAALLVAWGNQFSEDSTVLHGSLLSALGEGCTVRQVLPLPGTADAALRRVIRMLELMNAGGKYKAREIDAETTCRPLRGVHLPGGPGVFFLPEFDGRRFAAFAFSDTPPYFSEQFYSAFHTAHPKFVLYEATARGHLDLEEALLRLESRCRGRFLLKEGINSLMVPLEEWDWEQGHKKRKFQGTEGPRNWLSQVRHAKERRQENFELLVFSHDCYDICSLAEIQDFLLNDPTRSQPETTVASRLAIIEHLLSTLEKNRRYHLALTRGAPFKGVNYEVALDRGVVLEVPHGGPPGFHLEMHSPLLQQVFHRHFMATWDALRDSEKGKQEVCERLRTIHDELAARQ